MVGKKLRLLLLATGVFTLPIAGVRADVDWVPTGDKVSAAGFAVATDGTYEEGDRIVNTELLDDSGGSEEFRSPKKSAKFTLCSTTERQMRTSKKPLGKLVCVTL